jgi:hypothetical protein
MTEDSVALSRACRRVESAPVNLVDALDVAELDKTS